MFVKSFITFHKERAAEIGKIMFNKDDDLIVDFVSAASNIRAFNFSIPLEVKFRCVNHHLIEQI
jgi:ubiquitin-like 1-activating enzyme E1 B